MLALLDIRGLCIRILDLLEEDDEEEEEDV